MTCAKYRHGGARVRNAKADLSKHIHFSQARLPMTDYPRFEPFKGDPDVAHEAYHGGPLVSLVFRLVDHWMGKRQHRLKAAGGTEIHERPPILVPSFALPGVAEAMAPERVLYQIAPDEDFSRSFVSGSARTMKLQAGLLAAFFLVLGVLLVQGTPQPEPSGQTARSPVHPAKGLAHKSGTRPVLVAQELPEQGLP
jgi:hypothetical protein